MSCQVDFFRSAQLQRRKPIQRLPGCGWSSLKSRNIQLNHKPGGWRVSLAIWKMWKSNFNHPSYWMKKKTLMLKTTNEKPLFLRHLRSNSKYALVPGLTFRSWVFASKWPNQSDRTHSWGTFPEPFAASQQSRDPHLARFPPKKTGKFPTTHPKIRSKTSEKPHLRNPGCHVSTSWWLSWNQLWHATWLRCDSRASNNAWTIDYRIL